MAIDWLDWTQKIKDHIKSVSFKSRVEFRERNIELIKARGPLQDAYHIVATLPNETEHRLNTKYVLIAVGSSPIIPTISGTREFSITTDQLFYLENEPTNTLVVGDSCKF